MINLKKVLKGQKIKLYRKATKKSHSLALSYAPEANIFSCFCLYILGYLLIYR